MRTANESEGGMVTNNTSMEVPMEWFTVEEAARYLRVSKRTIYKWVSIGKLPAYLIGDHRYRRFRKSDLDTLPRPAQITTKSQNQQKEVT
jgi:excisionase family DNA binding protein